MLRACVIVFAAVVVLGFNVVLRKTYAPSVLREATVNQEVEARTGIETTLPVGVMTAIGPGASFPCAPSKEALPELMKWQKAMLDENAPDSVMDSLADALMRTRSIMLGTKDLVRVLDNERGILKVTVVEHSGSFGFAYMTETARGCWIVNEAVVR
jgi:hypothetical protein